MNLKKTPKSVRLPWNGSPMPQMKYVQKKKNRLRSFKIDFKFQGGNIFKLKKEIHGYLLQLVQALRYDKHKEGTCSDLAKFLMARASKNIQIAVKFFWNLTVEVRSLLFKNIMTEFKNFIRGSETESVLEAQQEVWSRG